MAASELLALGQKLIQVATPPSRVLSGTQTLRFGRIQHALDPAPKAGTSFRLIVPERLENGEHVVRRYFVDRKTPQAGGIVPQRHFPLRSVLGIAPRWSHGLDHLVGTFAERSAS